MKLLSIIAVLAFAFVANAQEGAATTTPPAHPAAAEMKDHKEMKKEHKAKKKAKKEEKAKEATH